MIESFEIKGFRKFDQIKFSNLNRINIFLGNNNAGKTTVLEAINGYACGTNILKLVKDSIQRHSQLASVYDFMDQLLVAFHNREQLPLSFTLRAVHSQGQSKEFVHQFHPGNAFADLEPRLIGTFGAIDKSLAKKTGKHVTRYLGHWESNGLEVSDIVFPFSEDSYQETTPHMRSRFVDLMTHRDREENLRIFSFLKRDRSGKMLGNFVHEMSKTYPSVTAIDCIPYPDGEMSPVSFMTKDGLIPIHSFGEGVQRWYSILGGMVVYSDSIHCIEEVDATFHPDAQKDLAVNLVRYAKKYNNQLFLTSHSLEFVDNLLDAIYGGDEKPKEDIIRIITLRNDPQTDQVRVRTLTGQEAFESREKFQLELR